MHCKNSKQIRPLIIIYLIPPRQVLCIKVVLFSEKLFFDRFDIFLFIGRLPTRWTDVS